MERTKMKGYVYILKCANGSYYTGSTTDLEKRLWQHQNGEGANFTKANLPVELVYIEEFSRIEDAFYREKQIQGWSRKKKEALIAGDFNALHKLAECQNASTALSNHASTALSNHASTALSNHASTALSNHASTALSNHASTALSNHASTALSNHASTALSNHASTALSNHASTALSNHASTALGSTPLTDRCN